MTTSELTEVTLPRPSGVLTTTTVPLPGLAPTDKSERRAPSLTLRLAAVFGLLLAATVSLVAGVTVMVARAQLGRALDHQLRGSAQSFQRGPGSRAHGPVDLAAQTRGWLAEHPLPAGQMAAIRLPGGRVLTSAGGLDLFEVPTPHALLTANRVAWWSGRGSEGGVRGLTVPIRVHHRQLGTLVLLAYERPLERTMNELVSTIERASLGGLAVALLLGVFVVGRSLRPLRTMAGEVSAIEATGDLSRRVELTRAPGEIGRLAAAFDRMLAGLEEGFQKQRRFLADASHELRTPLTVVRGQLEVLADELDGAHHELFSSAQDELDRMARIVEDLLLLARLDEGLELRPEPVELELVFGEALLRSMLRAPRLVRVEAEPDVYARADSERLLQVLTNLVTNAVKHTGEHGRVTLASTRENGRAVIRVSDDGSGIPPSELPHIFERFYRGAGARAAVPEGSGLGLAIAASLIAAMDGSIEVRSSYGEGTTFTVSLPLWPA